MSRQQLMQVIIDLSYSQGFYGRLYNQIMSLDEETRDDLFIIWENESFKDSIDFILFLES